MHATKATNKGHIILKRKKNETALGLNKVGGIRSNRILENLRENNSVEGRSVDFGKSHFQLLERQS